MRGTEALNLGDTQTSQVIAVCCFFMCMLLPLLFYENTSVYTFTMYDPFCIYVILQLKMFT